jgi:hypothetical protein
MDQFVSCNGLDCNVCSLLESTSNIFRWLLGISAVLAVLFLIFGGFFYLFSRGDKNRLQEARIIANYTVFGFVFALISFIAVHTLIWSIGGSSAGSWWKFDCQIHTDVVTKTISVLPKLATEIEDDLPILTNIASLSDLINSNFKIALLDAENMNAENWRQDLLSMDSENKIRLFMEDKGVSQEELAAFVKLSNGFFDDSTKNFDLDDLSKKFQNIADINRDDGDITIKTDPKTKLSKIDGSFWGEDSDISDKLQSLIGYLGQNNNNKDIVVGKNARQEGTMSSCIDSDGDWKEFRNECLAKAKVHGYENLKCSTVYNPTMGCQCPSDRYFIDGTCADKRSVDEIKNKKSECSKDELFTRTCPATRCEGSNLVTYPPSGKDTCEDGKVKYYSCTATNTRYDSTCDKIKYVTDINQKQNIANQNPNTYNQLKDYFNRSNPTNNPDNWGKNNNGGSDNGGSNNGGNNRGNNNQGGNNNTGDNNQMPPDQGPGNFNPTPAFEQLAECVGFKKGEKIPYNGVFVLLLNKNDPYNNGHPNQNVSRLFYLDRNGNVYGNNGDQNSNGLLVGAWTKGSGGSAWAPGWKIFSAHGTHKNEGDCSIQAGTGIRVGPKGEGVDGNGNITSANGKAAGMSACNMHSGNNRTHSSGCMTMGGTERCKLMRLVKSRATGDQGRVMMAAITADNTDLGSQKFSSDYCGNMDPEAAVNKIKSTSGYGNFDPMQGY